MSHGHSRAIVNPHAVPLADTDTGAGYSCLTDWSHFFKHLVNKVKSDYDISMEGIMSP